ncbi:hypothetical protein DB347_13050 [Opitutaceae bacterium EW11]|nr:hypothetical protein DB347_13050 [Opitutaceae bacterium EW11]
MSHSPSLRTLFALLLVAAAPLAHAAEGHNHAKHSPNAEHSSDAGTELGDRMDEMGDAFKALRRQIEDASKNPSSLEQVAILKKNATAALNLVPAKAADLPEADRPKFVSGYKTEMKKLLGHLDELEAALKAGDNAQAAKTLRAIGAEQKDAHREYRKPQD